LDRVPAAILHAASSAGRPWAVRSGRSVTASDPHSKHRIRVHPSVRSGPIPDQAPVGQEQWREPWQNRCRLLLWRI